MRNEIAIISKLEGMKFDEDKESNSENLLYYSLHTHKGSFKLFFQMAVLHRPEKQPMNLVYLQFLLQ